jgi:hypothetical protein
MIAKCMNLGNQSAVRGLAVLPSLFQEVVAHFEGAAYAPRALLDVARDG